MAGIADMTLVKIANDIGGNVKVTFLATKLKFSLQYAEQICSMNKDGKSEGTLKMLKDWRDNTKKRQQRKELREALCEGGLTEVAENHLPKGTAEQRSIYETYICSHKSYYFQFTENRLMNKSFNPT